MVSNCDKSFEDKQIKDWKQIARSMKHQLARATTENASLVKENKALRDLTTAQSESSAAQHNQLRDQLDAANAMLRQQVTIAECAANLRDCQGRLACATRALRELQLSSKLQQEKHNADYTVAMTEKDKLLEDAAQELQRAERQAAEEIANLKDEVTAANAEKCRLLHSLCKQQKEAQSLVERLDTPAVARDSGAKRKYVELTLEAMQTKSL